MLSNNIRKEYINPLIMIPYSNNPGAMYVNIANASGKKYIIVCCHNTINITIPTPGVSYTASTQFNNPTRINVVGVDGGVYSTYCVFKGLYTPFYISGLAGRVSYKILCLEYTDDVLLDYSQVIEPLITITDTVYRAVTNYVVATTRR